MMPRTAACLLLLALLGGVACGKYGPPERPGDPAERQAPEEAP